MSHWTVEGMSTFRNTQPLLRFISLSSIPKLLYSCCTIYLRRRRHDLQSRGMQQKKSEMNALVKLDDQVKIAMAKANESFDQTRVLSSQNGSKGYIQFGLSKEWAFRL